MWCVVFLVRFTAAILLSGNSHRKDFLPGLAHVICKQKTMLCIRSGSRHFREFLSCSLFPRGGKKKKNSMVPKTVRWILMMMLFSWPVLICVANPLSSFSLGANDICDWKKKSSTFRECRSCRSRNPATHSYYTPAKNDCGIRYWEKENFGSKKKRCVCVCVLFGSTHLQIHTIMLWKWWFFENRSFFPQQVKQKTLLSFSSLSDLSHSLASDGCCSFVSCRPSSRFLIVGQMMSFHWSRG